MDVPLQYLKLKCHVISALVSQHGEWTKRSRDWFVPSECETIGGGAGDELTVNESIVRSVLTIFLL